VVKLEVTRMSDLAIRALIALEPAGPRLKSGELAARLDATPAFMSQVMVPLVRQGWVDSGPGPTGGYQLTADLDGVSVLEVIEAVEGPTDTGQCVVADGPCGADGFCALHDAWTRARMTLAEHLATTSVAAVAGGVRTEPAPGGIVDG
jgi:Rrf2 family protein